MNDDWVQDQCLAKKQLVDGKGWRSKKLMNSILRFRWMPFESYLEKGIVNQSVADNVVETI